LSIALSSKDFNSFSVSNGTIASFGKGIYLENSSWNVVTGITFSHNNNGVIVNGTSQFNKIYNNIFNNVHNVVVFNGFYKNFFSVPIYWGKNILGGHFIGGNYWANHDGTGFSETCIDQDKNGLCDNGYPLAFGSIDSSPLSRAQLQKV
jgi:nitrous oxidase accessory protein NosD